MKQNPYVKGSFKQNGKTYDASYYYAVSGHIEVGVYCPDGHSMMPKNAIDDDASREAGSFAQAVCLKEGCDYYGITYKVFWPMIHLEAVVDSPDGQGDEAT